MSLAALPPRKREVGVASAPDTEKSKEGESEDVMWAGLNGVVGGAEWSSGRG